MPRAARPDPPYLRIVAEIGARIRSGELRSGERMPSIRQIAERWGVAVATATRAVAALREEGLVESKVGSGTIVSAGRKHPVGPAQPPPVAAESSRQALNREHMLRAAIAIADVEGLDAVSMRRVAAELGVGPMSLYRHVSTKDELVTEMADQVFGEPELPDPGPDGWRAKLELVSRLQWSLCWRHPWLPRAVSFTRPSFAPNLVAHTEWTLRALDELGLSKTTRMQEALTLHSLVITAALSMADEVEAEQESGLTQDRWLMAQRARADELFASGRYPLLAEMREEAASDLDGLFEYGLARHLDGFAVLVAERTS
ncbi:TetR/AcrR family transcriptional regulator C-terminal domain-containing protein [Prauserella cavernicola]|uniref:TetR/AcrR family transcriptional regulator C-terminal domain-containing protein n=1 Tax=Prauserella cavernicola TaxID=2800127 RepID=A0A934QQR5_9PSEU|nr:GntR family transcriptional regulator [Prauserella cavernicola]MBK1784880.1 TetR/AcrR family transcriptional regulator C-terminal domain-containing protein [Prauserella cavernicola]